MLRWRQRSRLADFLMAIVDGIGEHRIAQHTALVAHFGFLSVFPLMLVLTTVLGFVLDGRPELRAKILDSAASRIPIIGNELASDPGRFTGHTIALILGSLLTLWGGTRAFMAMQTALDDIATVPWHSRANIAVGRLRALIGMGVIGAAQVGAAAISVLAGVATFGPLKTGLLIVAAVAINTMVLLGTYRWLCHRPRPWRELVPGAVFGGVTFAALQLLGTSVVGRAISRASPVYGTFATVIALMSWLSLHAFLALLGAQINEVVARPDRLRAHRMTGKRRYTFGAHDRHAVPPATSAQLAEAGNGDTPPAAE